jgi:small subunit ribosomal protein S13
MVFQISNEEMSRIRRVIESLYYIEGNLKKRIVLNIKELIEIKCYRGMRHLTKLPVRGQRTHTNARTRRKHKL